MEKNFDLKQFHPKTLFGYRKTHQSTAVLSCFVSLDVLCFWFFSKHLTSLTSALKSKEIQLSTLKLHVGQLDHRLYHSVFITTVSKDSSQQSEASAHYSVQYTGKNSDIIDYYMKIKTKMRTKSQSGHVISSCSKSSWTHTFYTRDPFNCILPSPVDKGEMLFHFSIPVNINVENSLFERSVISL